MTEKHKKKYQNIDDEQMKKKIQNDEQNGREK